MSYRWRLVCLAMVAGVYSASTAAADVREDGVAFDQIVLSPVTYATVAPGPVGGDHTIIPK